MTILCFLFRGLQALLEYRVLKVKGNPPNMIMTIEEDS